MNKLLKYTSYSKNLKMFVLLLLYKVFFNVFLVSSENASSQICRTKILLLWKVLFWCQFCKEIESFLSLSLFLRHATSGSEVFWVIDFKFNIASVFSIASMWILCFNRSIPVGFSDHNYGYNPYLTILFTLYTSTMFWTWPQCGWGFL